MSKNKNRIKRIGKVKRAILFALEDKPLTIDQIKGQLKRDFIGEQIVDLDLNGFIQIKGEVIKLTKFGKFRLNTLKG